MKNIDIDFTQTFNLLEEAVKQKFSKFKYVIDDCLKEYKHANSDDNDEFIPTTNLKIFYPDKQCFFSDVLENKKDQYFVCGEKEALVHITHMIRDLSFEKSFSFFINLTPVENEQYRRIEVSYYSETNLISILLIKSFSVGFIGPKKGVIVKKQF